MRLKEIKMMTIMSLALAFALTAIVAAQQGAKPGKQKPGGQMTMDEMMKECRKHCQETSKSIDQTTKALEEANRSNDQARMRAANDQAMNALAEMKNHMSMCMNMMDMMHGKGRKKQ